MRLGVGRIPPGEPGRPGYPGEPGADTFDPTGDATESTDLTGFTGLTETPTEPDVAEPPPCVDCGEIHDIAAKLDLRIAMDEIDDIDE